MTAFPSTTAAPSAGPGSAPDPVGALRFTVDAPGMTIGRFSECSGLGVEYSIVEYQEGGQNAFTHKLRGPLRYRNLVLKRGITGEEALLSWFGQTQDLQKRPTITVSLVGPDAKAVRRWHFENAFPVRWSGPALNAAGNAVASEELEIAHRGFLGSVAT
jgi:phage tail-like protein